MSTTSLFGQNDSMNVSDTSKKEMAFDVAEEMPEFPGGIEAMFEFLASEMNYPLEAYSNGIQGKVVVRFIVDRDGELRDIEVLKKVHPLLDEEGIRVVKMMPKWTPGKQRGKNVSVYMNLPLMFKTGG